MSGAFSEVALASPLDHDDVHPDAGDDYLADGLAGLAGDGRQVGVGGISEGLQLRLAFRLGGSRRGRCLGLRLSLCGGLGRAGRGLLGVLTLHLDGNKVVLGQRSGDLRALLLQLLAQATLFEPGIGPRAERIREKEHAGQDHQIGSQRFHDQRRLRGRVKVSSATSGMVAHSIAEEPGGTYALRTPSMGALRRRPPRLSVCGRGGAGVRPGCCVLAAQGRTMMIMHIQPIILAGGSGVRLWPASRQNYPKQLLALTGPHSLLQETALRLQGLTEATVAPSPIVVTNEEHRFLVSDQLHEIGMDEPRIVLEPAGRNTAPALTLAALLGEDDGGDPLLLVMPSDHLIADLPAFQDAVSEAAVLAGNGAFATFGIVPDRPENGYGYIQAGDPVPGSASARSLEGFREKPDAETAGQLIADGGFLWNSGIFMVRQSVWLSAIGSCRPDILAACRASMERITLDGPFVRVGREEFCECPSDSIDYAVLERLESTTGMSGGQIQAVVVPLRAGWSDVGGWSALWEVSPKDADGTSCAEMRCSTAPRAPSYTRTPA